MAVAQSSRHFVGVREVWIGTSQSPRLGFSLPAPSQTRCLDRAAPQIARFEAPAGMFTTPAKRSRHDIAKTLLAAGRPLRCEESTHVYSNDL
jgi:hypothetical protein